MSMITVTVDRNVKVSGQKFSVTDLHTKEARTLACGAFIYDFKLLHTAERTAERPFLTLPPTRRFAPLNP